jgi:hypothetical protein
MGFFIPIITYLAKSVITGFAISKAISWLAPKPEVPEFQQDTEAQGVLLNKQSNNANIPVVYGTRKVGGTRVFLETSGTDNQYLYGAIVLCEGEVNAITSIIVNDSAVTFSASIANGTTITSNDSKFGTTIQVQPFYGTDDQSASSLLTTLSSWTSNHKLSGLCYIAFRFTWDNDKYTGIPNIQAIVQGKKVVAYNSSSVAQSAAFSSNPSWCLLDYLTNTRYGKGIPIGDIDIPTFYSASQTAVTQVTPYSGGSQINLFDCNAVIDTGQKLIDNTRTILKGMRGFLPYTQGKYKLIIETTGSSVLTLDEDNIIGGIKVSSSRKNEKFNRVQVNFVNPDKNYQSDTIIYDTDHSTLKTADGGFLQEGVIDLPTITNPYQALEFGEIVLKRSRDNLGLEITANYEAMNLAIGDLVAVTHAITGFSSKIFRVMGMAINPSFEVSLSLIEHDDDWYTFASKTEVASVPNTSFPDPFTTQPPASITLTDELIEYGDGVVLTRLNILIGASTDNFVQNYIVEAKKTSESAFKLIGQGSELNYEMLNVIDGENYSVRAKAVNSLGVSSSFITATRDIVGGVDAPSNVEDFAIEMHGQDHMKLTWTPPSANTDLDISFYDIRYQNVTSGATWINSTNLVRCVRRKCDHAIIPARTGSYLIRAIDKNGNSSLEPSIVTTNISDIQAYKQISTFTETPNILTASASMDSSFPLAVKIDASGDTVLTLDTVTNFDDTVGNFDSVEGDFELGGTDTTSNSNNFNSNRDAKGFYNFTNSISLSNIFDGNIEPTITLDAENPYDKFDSGRGALLFDEAKAPFDGNEQLSAFHRVQIATSTTSLADCTTFVDITQSATFKFRFAKFRLKLTNDDAQTSSNVKSIAIKLNMEERTFSENDLATSSGTKTITYTNPFQSTPAVGIATQNMQTGDFYTITSKTRTGFTINFFNSSGSAVDRTFDYISKGFGLQSS